MDNKKYWNARGYAFRLYPDSNPLDLVHDCYVSWYNSHETNLFDQDMALIYHAIKIRHFDDLRRRHKFKWRGEVGTREFLSLSAFKENGDPLIELPSSDKTDSLVIVNQIEDSLLTELKKLHKKDSTSRYSICNLLKQGYTNTDIREKLGLAKATIHRNISVIKESLQKVVLG